jgi:hypothetical protein
VPAATSFGQVPSTAGGVAATLGGGDGVGAGGALPQPNSAATNDRDSSEPVVFLMAAQRRTSGRLPRR